jgi:integrase
VHGRWVAVVADSETAGYTASGGRKRVTVTAKTEAEVKRKQRNAQATFNRDRETDQRVTVKAWADEYLKIRVRDLSPKGYNAAASPIRKWIIPTIGHRRLEQLTPRDVRSVADAQRNAKPKPRQPGDTHRVLLTMLNWAVGEGHHVPSSVLAMKAPKSEKSDRAAMTVDQGLACLAVAAELPHGSRWLFTLLYGQRLGECLGLTWDAIDLDAGEFGEARIEWQLQALQYNVPRDRSSGFRVPDGHESRHLVDAFHLVRPRARPATGWCRCCRRHGTRCSHGATSPLRTRGGSSGPTSGAGPPTTSTTAPSGGPSRRPRASGIPPAARSTSTSAATSRPRCCSTPGCPSTS